MCPVHRPGLPPEVRKVFDVLREEVVRLHANWDAFQQLFGDPESVAALNSVAPGAFALLHHNFRHELVMGVCRITDPKETRVRGNVKENLTLERLLHVVRENSQDQAFYRGLKPKLKAIDKHLRPIRDHRNRYVGHLDLQTAVQYQQNPLPDVTREHVAEALRLLADFLNDVSGR